MLDHQMPTGNKVARFMHSRGGLAVAILGLVLLVIVVLQKGPDISLSGMTGSEPAGIHDRPGHNTGGWGAAGRRTSHIGSKVPSPDASDCGYYYDESEVLSIVVCNKEHDRRQRAGD